MLHLKRFVFNFIEENTYIVYDDNGEAVVVDCGANAPGEERELRDFVKQHGLTLRRHLLTHAHFDHIFGAQFIYDEYGVKPEICAAEKNDYDMALQYMQIFLHCELPLQLPPCDVTLTDGAEITVGEISIRVISTPGHTAGGLCFYIPKAHILLSGDTIFRYSVGRTDLPGGSMEDLRDSITQRILVLPPETRIYPGHGPETSVADESRAVDFF